MESTQAIILAVITAICSGMATGIYAGVRDNKKESKRRAEREQDGLKLELKDLEIKLYKLEKDLNAWREKYYDTLKELIEVKFELEQTLVKLTHVSLLDE